MIWNPIAFCWIMQYPQTNEIHSTSVHWSAPLFQQQSGNWHMLHNNKYKEDHSSDHPKSKRKKRLKSKSALNYIENQHSFIQVLIIFTSMPYFSLAFCLNRKTPTIGQQHASRQYSPPFSSRPEALLQIMHGAQQ